MLYFQWILGSGVDSIYDILDILDFAELGKDVADLTTEYGRG